MCQLGCAHSDLLICYLVFVIGFSRMLKVHAHTESCRALRFINGGQGIYLTKKDEVVVFLDIIGLMYVCMLIKLDFGVAILTGSPDCSLLATDVETGSAVARLDEAHG